MSSINLENYNRHMEVLHQLLADEYGFPATASRSEVLEAWNIAERQLLADDYCLPASASWEQIIEA